MKLINFVLFQLGWFISVWGAANQKLPLSMMVVALILLAHIMQASRKKEATMLLFIIMLLGSIFDQLLLITNLVTYQNQFFDTLVPVWIVAMWGLFATTLNLSLSWLKSNRVLAGFIWVYRWPCSLLCGRAIKCSSTYKSIFNICASAWLGNLNPSLLAYCWKVEWISHMIY
jgi:hypothetical protein